MEIFCVDFHVTFGPICSIIRFACIYAGTFKKKLKRVIIQMFVFNFENWTAFQDCVSDIIHTETVQSMREFRHHVNVSCYEHSVFVAYISFRIARKMGLDSRACARAGLLHDLYLYDSKEIRENHYTTHARIALENASRLCELTKKEKNIIESHMWPLGDVTPASREAYIVNFADKYCATLEALHIWHRMSVRDHLPVPDAA